MPERPDQRRQVQPTRVSSFGALSRGEFQIELVCFAMLKASQRLARVHRVCNMVSACVPGTDGVDLLLGCQSRMLCLIHDRTKSGSDHGDEQVDQPVLENDKCNDEELDKYRSVAVEAKRSKHGRQRQQHTLR